MLLQIPTHDQRIGPRRGKVDNNRGPRGSFNGWLHAGGFHDVQSRITHAAHLQDEYPTATVPAAHRSGLDGGVHTRLLGVTVTPLRRVELPGWKNPNCDLTSGPQRL